MPNVVMSPVTPSLVHSSSKDANSPRSDMQEHIQRQLAEVLRGQENLAKLITKLSVGGVPQDVTIAPRAEFFQITPPVGDATEPRWTSSDKEDMDCQMLAKSPVNGLAPGSLESALENGPPSVPSDISQNVSGLDANIFSQLECEEQAARSALERRKARLAILLKDNRKAKEKDARKKKLLQEKWERGLCWALSSVDAEKQHLVVDAISAIIIFLNTIFIGFSLDYKESDGWNAWLFIDIGFVVVFLLELFVKLTMSILRQPPLQEGGDVSRCTTTYALAERKQYWRGFLDYFLWGRDRFSNTFDATIVVLDIFQLIITIRDVRGGDAQNKPRSASVLRVMRLIRMVRIVRLFRLDMLKNFVDMMQGILDGASTLIWAILVFLLMVYACGILCKISFGTASDSEKTKEVYPYFDSVQRSMLTVFRCCFGDCSTKNGTPIPEFIVEQNGAEYGLAYCLFIFFITIGLFNIVSAIFVDTTMAASAAAAAKHRHDRLYNKKLWATNVATILESLLKGKTEKDIYGVDPDAMENDIEKLIQIEFNRTELDHAIKNDDQVISALARLDIDVQDHELLSDILDPDHSGFIDVLELVEGLRRLRGDPRRSDVVSVNLMIRSLQARADEMLQEIMELKSRK